MKLRQLILLSWNEEDKIKGFHVYAQSHGIEERDIYAVAKCLAYRPSEKLISPTVKNLAETARLLGFPKRGENGLHFALQREIDSTFPTDSAFFVLPSGALCVARVTYCGVDYRLNVWGNYIIHAYIFGYDPDISPVSVLLSQNFKTYLKVDDLQPRRTSPPIPVFDMTEPVSSLEALGKLVKMKGAGTLSRILDCIFTAMRRGMDIYINASDKDILFWMHVCQSLLPYEITALLPFSTCRFAPDDGTPFRIKHIITKLGSDYSYKLSAGDQNHISIDIKNGIFSDSANKLQLSSLLTYLLLNDTEGLNVLRELIGTYVKTHGVIDSDEICLIYRLARSDVYDGISEFELCKTLDDAVLRSFGSETVDSVVEKYLDATTDGSFKIRLYGHLASYHTCPEKIMTSMFYRMLDELSSGRMTFREALDKLSDEPFGQTTFAYVMDNLPLFEDVFERAMSEGAQRSFVFRLLFTGFYDMRVLKAADTLISLIPTAVKCEKERESVIPESITELISVVDFDENIYRRVIYAYFDYCRSDYSEFSAWCSFATLLFEEGRKLNSEAGLTTFTVQQFDRGELYAYMKTGNIEAANVLKLLGMMRHCGALSEKGHANLIYRKFKAYLYSVDDFEIATLVIDALKNENEMLVDALSVYSRLDAGRTLEIFKAKVARSRPNDIKLLTALGGSSVSYIGEMIVSSNIKSWESFLAYIKDWYLAGSYEKSFSRSFKKAFDDCDAHGSRYFLGEVLNLCKGRFLSSERSDYDLWVNTLDANLSLYLGKDATLIKLLSDARRIGGKLPTFSELVYESENSLAKQGDMSLSLAREFLSNATENNKKVYLSVYMQRLVGMCVGDSDRETISSAVTVMILGADREMLERFIKILSRLSSASVRIILSRIVEANVISSAPERVNEIFCATAKHISTNDYLQLKNNTLSRYGVKKYGQIFRHAEDAFGILARKKLEIAEKNK